MINIFKFKDTLNYPLERSAGIDVLYKYFRLDYDLINAYYKNREIRIANTNILVRLIKQLDTDINKDIIDYIEYINIDYRYKAKALNLTNDLNKGTIFKSLIGETSVIIENSFLNPFECDTYDDLSVIKVLYTDNTDLKMNHPTTIKTGNYVFMLDIVGMMVQYRKWSFDRIKNGTNNSPNIFVSQVLYTNLIKDILEFGIYNRFYTNIFSEDSVSTHTIAVRDYDNKVNNVLLKLNDKLRSKQLRYTQFLQYIPMPFNKDAYELLFFGNLNTNRQNIWAIFLSRIKIMNEIMEFLGSKNVRRNRDLIVSYRLFIKEIKFNRIMDSTNWGDLFIYINILYNNSLKISKNRGV